MMHYRGISRAVSALLIVTLPTAGLARPRWEPSDRVKWADEAGSVTVSPISVMRWEEAVPLLQPKFAMSPDIALAAAMPTTQSLDERLTSLFTANARLALPTTSVVSAETTTGDTANQNFATSLDRTRTETRGTVPDSLAAATLPALSAAGLAAAADVPEFGRDPMLRYLAATAVYQEVNLLNEYVKQALRYRGAQAFLVRMQVSVLPARRSLPYDVTADLTLHAADMQARALLAQQSFNADAVATSLASESKISTEEAARQKREADLRADLAYARAYAAALELKKPVKEAQEAGEAAAAPLRRASVQRCPGKWDTLNVVPLVVTDNLEGLAASRTTDTATQMGLALLATIANVGASGQFSQMREALRRSQGRDTNSLLTVARLTDDTVRVRLGAAQSPRLGNTMLPRSHNISLLVIYRPCDEQILAGGEERIISTVARASYTDVFTGETLPYQPAGPRLLALTRKFNQKYNNRFSYLEYAGLYRLVAQQNRDQYEQFFRTKIQNFRANHNKKRDGCVGLSNDPGFLARLFYPNLFRPEDEAGEKFLFPEMSNLPYDCYREQLAFQVASNTLWTDLQSIRPFPEYSYANIPIVLQRIEPELPHPGQTVMVAYGDGGATLTLAGGRHLRPAREITGLLYLTDASETDKDKAKTLVTLASSSGEASADGTAITLKFPPFLGAAPEAPPAKPFKFAASQLTLSVGRMDDGRSIHSWQGEDDKAKRLDAPDNASTARPNVVASQQYKELKLFPDKPSSDTPDYALSAPAAAILVGPDSKGRLTVFLKQNKAEGAISPIVLTVDGAEVISVTGPTGAVAAGDIGWTITKGPITLEFANLLPGQKVTIGLVSGDGKKIAAKAIEKLVYAKMAEPAE